MPEKRGCPALNARQLGRGMELGPEAGGACGGSGGSDKLFLVMASQATSCQGNSINLSLNRSERTCEAETGLFLGQPTARIYRCLVTSGLEARQGSPAKSTMPPSQVTGESSNGKSSMLQQVG